MNKVPYDEHGAGVFCPDMAEGRREERLTGCYSENVECWER